MRIFFGKHKGSLITDLPSDYLIWLSNQDLRDARLRQAVDSECRFRFPGQYRDDDFFESGSRDLSGMVDRQKIKNVYRSLCREFHPDKGGSTLAQQIINRFYEAVTS